MKKMLLIDDELLFRQSIRYQLDWERCGFWIAGEASNGQEGLELLERLRPDLILCDLVMPVVDGVEFVRLARRRPDCPPIFMLSNYDEFEKVRKAFVFGATDYLLKSSFTAAVLLDAVKRHSLWVEPGGARTAGDFSLLARQALDGYTLAPYKSLCAHVRRELPFPVYHLLYLDASPTAPSRQGDRAGLLDTALSRWPHLCAMESHGNAVAVIGAEAPLSHQAAWELLSAVQAALPHCRCVVGGPLSGLETVREQVDSLAAITGYSIYQTAGLQFFQPEFHAGADSPPLDEARYFELLEQGRITEATESLLTWLRAVAAGHSMPPYELKKLLENTMYNTINRMKSAIPDNAGLSALGLKTLKRIDQAVLLGDIIGAVEAAFALIGRLLPEKDPIISRVSAYIEENYHRSITLQSAAEQLHINYAYLSSYISGNTGLHFNEHLNRLRIAHAKRRLLDTDEPISAISEDVGFTDQSYFGKVFKKLVGKTPLQFRSRSRRGERRVR